MTKLDARSAKEPLQVHDVPFRNATAPEKRGNPAKVIRQLVREFGETPYKINDGNCGLFADAFVERLGGSIWGTGFESSFAHVFVEYKGKFYDAEAPNGVLEWKDLPLFKKQLLDFTNVDAVIKKAERKGRPWRKETSTLRLRTVEARLIQHAAPVTLKQINAELKKRGVDATLVKGRGYFYFTGPATDGFYSTSVAVHSLSAFTLDGWMKEWDYLVKSEGR